MNSKDIYLAGGCFCFDPAETCHQDSLAKNPFGYCHIDLKKADQPLQV